MVGTVINCKMNSGLKLLTYTMERAAWCNSIDVSPKGLLELPCLALHISYKNYLNASRIKEQDVLSLVCIAISCHFRLLSYALAAKYIYKNQKATNINSEVCLDVMLFSEHVF